MEGEEGGGQGVQTKPSQGVWPVAYTSNCQMRFITGELGLRFDGDICSLFCRCCGTLLWNPVLACVCVCMCLHVLSRKLMTDGKEREHRKCLFTTGSDLTEGA